MEAVQDMNGAQPSAAARREAAVWIARVHAPEREEGVAAGLRRWLEESAAHRAAFEKANELWELAGRIPEDAVPRVMRWKRQVGRPRVVLRPAFAGLGLLLIVSALAAVGLWHAPLVTGVGEQRSVTLADGTRISLNTATRMEVHFTRSLRRVELEAGEALFDVAADARRPFVVDVGRERIRVLGTSFVVRYEPASTAVTVVEGKVEVEGGPAVERGEMAREALVLTPGQRLVVGPKKVAALDRPAVDKVTAWQRGLVALDHTPLVDAVAEMNRYSRLQLEIGTPEAGDARISGVFRAGDSVYFAQAIARTYGLEVERQDGKVVLSGRPREDF